MNHGFKDCPAPYQLTISPIVESAILLLQVTDKGRGMTHERLTEPSKSSVQSENEGGGVALLQLLQTLRLIFGESVELSFDSVVDKGSVAMLKRPKKK